MKNSEMATEIIYDRYEILNRSVNMKHSITRYIERRIYRPVSKSDYDRVMAIFESKPDEYKLVTVNYGFGWAK